MEKCEICKDIMMTRIIENPITMPHGKIWIKSHYLCDLCELPANQLTLDETALLNQYEGI